MPIHGSPSVHVRESQEEVESVHPMTMEEIFQRVEVRETLERGTGGMDGPTANSGVSLHDTDQAGGGQVHAGLAGGYAQVLGVEEEARRGRAVAAAPAGSERQRMMRLATTAGTTAAIDALEM